VKRSPLLALLLAPLLAAAAGCASADRDLAPRLVDLEHRWVEALRTHDAAVLDRLLDDRFVDSTYRGALRTKNEVLTGPPAGGPYHSLRLEELAVRRAGRDAAVVTGVNVLQGATAADRVRVRFTDVFVRDHGAWRALSAQETVQAGPTPMPPGGEGP
jgi:Domain of unknown function (DUF4440)